MVYKMIVERKKATVELNCYKQKNHINNQYLSIFAENMENSVLTALTWTLFSLTRIKTALFW